MSRWKKSSLFKYSSPTPKILLSGVGALLAAFIVNRFEYILNAIFQLLEINKGFEFGTYENSMIIVAIILFTIAPIEYLIRSDKRHIKYLIIKRLCKVAYGNPLHLIEGEIEPHVYVVKTESGYRIKIECKSALYEDIANLETTISDCLIGRYGNYAVVSKEEDIAGRYVDYYIEDVVTNYNKQSIYYSLDDIPADTTKIYIRDDVYIDYSKVLNSSAIIAGKSRSGKTTAIISTFLLPILKLGKDDFGSRVIIVDPKSAELSLCPYVLSPKNDGNVEHILNAIREFNRLRIRRQKIINDASKKTGRAKKWFDIGMKPSILFLDEFVSIQDMFPKKPTKEKPDYSLAEFQGLLRQIATQGASAGCFLILSTAEASVGTGGLETAVNNACGIRILFKPSKEEARFLWGTEKLEVLRERNFNAGDAWFSADDGNNNSVKFIKFPRMEFGEYKALSKLLSKYYEDNKRRHDSTQ